MASTEPEPATGLRPNDEMGLLSGLKAMQAQMAHNASLEDHQHHKGSPAAHAVGESLCAGRRAHSSQSTCLDIEARRRPFWPGLLTSIIKPRQGTQGLHSTWACRECGMGGDRPAGHCKPTRPALAFPDSQ